MNMPIAIAAMQRMIVLRDINVKKKNNESVDYQPGVLLNLVVFVPSSSVEFHETS